MAVTDATTQTFIQYQQWKQNAEAKKFIESNNLGQELPEIYSEVQQTPTHYNILNGAQNPTGEDYENKMYELANSEFDFRNEVDSKESYATQEAYLNDKNYIQEDEWVKAEVYNYAKTMYGINSSIPEDSEIDYFYPTDDKFAKIGIQATIMFDFMDKDENGQLDKTEMLRYFMNKDALNSDGELNGFLSSDLEVLDELTLNHMEDGYLDFVTAGYLDVVAPNTAIPRRTDLVKWYYDWFYNHEVQQNNQN